jgi:uncharacterized membrane protein
VSSQTKNAVEKSENDEERITISNRFFILLILGFVFLTVGVIIVLATAVFNSGSTSFGGVIFIGPFPIVFGAGPDAAWLIAIGIAIAVLSIIVFIMMRRRMG